MQRQQIVYDPISLHWSSANWSSAWLRWAGTLRGLCVGTAVMSVLAVGPPF